MVDMVDIEKNIQRRRRGGSSNVRIINIIRLPSGSDTSTM